MCLKIQHIVVHNLDFSGNTVCETILIAVTIVDGDNIETYKHCAIKIHKEKLESARIYC